MHFPTTPIAAKPSFTQGMRKTKAARRDTDPPPIRQKEYTQMKTIFGMMAMILASSPAMADGFVCESAREGLVVKIFNHVNPEQGTRNGAVMVLSDSEVQAGRKTIARFTDVNGTLASSNLVYTAKVDHRFNDSGSKGELLAGTKIGALKTIALDVAFTYTYPVADGAYVRGDLLLTKRNGDEVRVALDCARYLKN